MSDLISREALIKELETFDEEFELQIDEVYALIANAPAITPQQPQEQDELVKKAVADALEDVANSLYAQITWSDDSDDKTTIINETLLEATRQIRALIERNAKGVE